MRLWDLSKVIVVYGLDQIVLDVVEQFGWEPQGEAPCDCNPCTTQHFDKPSHLEGIERTMWTRLNAQGKQDVLLYLHEENHDIRWSIFRLLEGENALFEAWKEVRPRFKGVATPESLNEADDWISDVTSATLEALFPWKDVHTSLLARPLPTT